MYPYSTEFKEIDDGRNIDMKDVKEDIETFRYRSKGIKR